MDKSKIQFGISDRLEAIVGEEIQNMFNAKRDFGTVAYFPGFTVYISIGKKLKETMFTFKVSEITNVTPDERIIYVGANTSLMDEL